MSYVGPMLLGPRPHSAGPCCRVLCASGVETTQQAVPSPASRRRGGGEESRGTRGISLRQQHPRGASGASDDADRAQAKRWNQRTQKAAGQVLAHLHPGHLCPSYTPFLIHPLLKCRFFRCKQADLQTESQLFQTDPSANTAGFHSNGGPRVDNSWTEVDGGAGAAGAGGQ